MGILTALRKLDDRVLGKSRVSRPTLLRTVAATVATSTAFQLGGGGRMWVAIYGFGLAAVAAVASFVVRS